MIKKVIKNRDREMIIKADNYFVKEKEDAKEEVIDSKYEVCP